MSRCLFFFSLYHSLTDRRRLLRSNSNLDRAGGTSSAGIATLPLSLSLSPVSSFVLSRSFYLPLLLFKIQHQLSALRFVFNGCLLELNGKSRIQTLGQHLNRQRIISFFRDLNLFFFGSIFSFFFGVSSDA